MSKRLGKITKIVNNKIKLYILINYNLFILNTINVIVTNQT